MMKFIGYVVFNPPNPLWNLWTSETMRHELTQTYPRALGVLLRSRGWWGCRYVCICVYLSPLSLSLCIYNYIYIYYTYAYINTSRALHLLEDCTLTAPSQNSSSGCASEWVEVARNQCARPVTRLLWAFKPATGTESTPANCWIYSSQSSKLFTYFTFLFLHDSCFFYMLPQWAQVAPVGWRLLESQFVHAPLLLSMFLRSLSQEAPQLRGKAVKHLCYWHHKGNGWGDRNAWKWANACERWSVFMPLFPISLLPSSISCDMFTIWKICCSSAMPLCSAHLDSCWLTLSFAGNEGRVYGYQILGKAKTTHKAQIQEARVFCLTLSWRR